eukprot:1275376-Prymnesium_polylepis.1
MRAAPVPSERSSTAGRIIRPAVRTGGVIPPVHNQPVSRYVTGRNGKGVGFGPRTILPHLLRGVTPPSMPYVSDR